MPEIMLVSVIITTCNRCELLPRAINSVLNQTYKNIEIIIVDDCSKDKTQEIIKNYQEQNSNIVYIKNEIPSGANVSRNKGIKISQGKFIAGLDDDDEFLPNRIELLLKNYDDKYAFITSWNIVIKKGNIKSYRKPKEEIELNDILVNNLIMNQALIEKQRIIKIGMYDENLLACQDYDIWLRLILKYGKVKVVQEYLQIIHEDDNINRISSNSMKKFKSYFNFFKKYKYLMNKEEKKAWYFKLYSIREKIFSKKILLLLLNEINESEITNYYYEKYGLIQKYNTIINLYNFINSLDLTKKYILYGYGSVGKLILPHIQDYIIGIIDENIQNTQIINNIKILKKEDIIKYNDVILLITPIIHINKIIEELNLNDNDFIQVKI